MNMRSIYRKIAKKHGVSVAEVKRSMQHALNTAYASKPNETVPALDDFIRHTAAQMKNTHTA